ncbi:fumarylacetoacetate hydrolase family protein [Thermoflexus sp.]|uniref:fumarylacetoacetate hydrolase family protein n=1 Tax=Thermoflexus sp. TaxID=1969742 RepID=UPI002ADE49E8|nr:fumarylacetoacetate hydrolase family protein [Thermoflexus sp.]
MRIGRILTESGPQFVIIEDDQLYTLSGDPFQGQFAPGDPLGPMAAATWLAPCVPSKIVAVGRNYVEHAREQEAEVPPEPLIFLKPPSAVIGPGSPIRLPPQSRQVEHEAELAVVIGRRGKNIPEHEAWAYVLGVTCGNDVTARDLQRRDGQWTRSKGFDTFCPLGPWIVTHLSPEEICNAEIICRVNGEVRQWANTREMVFSVPTLIAYISSVMTLEPGDVILTGTPAGVGPLRPGDWVEVEIQGIGVLKNPVEGTG